MENINEDSLCPSFRYEEGSKLLGVRQNGKMAILPNPLELDESFKENVKTGYPAEQRFRFVNKCALSGCKQWTGKACGVALRAVYFMNSLSAMPTLPPCSIRPSCRWHQQEGDKICTMCPYIITDITSEELNDYFTNKINSSSEKLI